MPFFYDLLSKSFIPIKTVTKKSKFDAVKELSFQIYHIIGLEHKSIPEVRPEQYRADNRQAIKRAQVKKYQQENGESNFSKIAKNKGRGHLHIRVYK